jgi:hypothetical protein
MIKVKYRKMKCQFNIAKIGHLNFAKKYRF